MLIGSILILISLYNLAKNYQTKEIFTNALYGVLSTIIGAIISLTLIAATPIGSTLKDSIYRNIPDWNGNWINILGSSSKWGNIFSTTLRQCTEWILLVLIVVWVFLIITIFFMRRSMKKLAKHSNNDTFTTTGNLLIIGAAIPIIGLIIIWIATLTLAQAFFNLRENKPTPSPPNSSQLQTTTTTLTNNEIKAYCPYCGTPTPPENIIYCPNCGKQQ